MEDLRVVTDLDQCEELWRRIIPQETVTDLWEVRACFQAHFRRPACFLVAEDVHGICGLLPVSWIEESQCYGYFPGETWDGHTWLEQNRIPANASEVLETLLGHCPSPYQLRYLTPSDRVPLDGHAIDEIGYLFAPPAYDYDLDNYLQEFSRKSAKRLRREIAAMDARGTRYRHDDLCDFGRLVDLNVDRFGERSYFHDPRFRESFRDLMHFLHDRGWLRVTTVTIGDDVAAVDMGCVYRGTYTLLAGGTHADYPGIAKLINVHHMRRACNERLQQVDFLCGDFCWKRLFHLTPRPLYMLASDTAELSRADETDVGRPACVR